MLRRNKGFLAVDSPESPLNVRQSILSQNGSSSNKKSPALYSSKTKGNNTNTLFRVRTMLSELCQGLNPFPLDAVFFSHYHLSSSGSCYVPVSDTIWIGGLRDGLVYIYDLKSYPPSVSSVINVSGNAILPLESDSKLLFSATSPSRLLEVPVMNNDRALVYNNLSHWSHGSEENPNKSLENGILGIFSPLSEEKASNTAQALRFGSSLRKYNKPPPGNEMVWVFRRNGTINGHCPHTGQLLNQIFPGERPLNPNENVGGATISFKIGSQVWLGHIGGNISVFDIPTGSLLFSSLNTHPDTALYLNYYAPLDLMISTSMLATYFFHVKTRRILGHIDTTGVRWSHVPVQKDSSLFNLWLFGQNGFEQYRLENDSRVGSLFIGCSLKLKYTVNNTACETISNFPKGLTSGIMIDGNILATSKIKDGDYARVFTFDPSDMTKHISPFALKTTAVYSLRAFQRSICPSSPVIICGMKLEDGQQYLGFFRTPEHLSGLLNTSNEASSQSKRTGYSTYSASSLTYEDSPGNQIFKRSLGPLTDKKKPQVLTNSVSIYGDSQQSREKLARPKSSPSSLNHIHSSRFNNSASVNPNHTPVQNNQFVNEFEDAVLSPFSQFTRDLGLAPSTHNSQTQTGMNSKRDPIPSTSTTTGSNSKLASINLLGMNHGSGPTLFHQGNQGFDQGSQMNNQTHLIQSQTTPDTNGSSQVTSQNPFKSFDPLTNIFASEPNNSTSTYNTSQNPNGIPMQNNAAVSAPGYFRNVQSIYNVPHVNQIPQNPFNMGVPNVNTQIQTGYQNQAQIQMLPIVNTNLIGSENANFVNGFQPEVQNSYQNNLAAVAPLVDISNLGATSRNPQKIGSGNVSNQPNPFLKGQNGFAKMNMNMGDVNTNANAHQMQHGYMIPLNSTGIQNQSSSKESKNPFSN